MRSTTSLQHHPAPCLHSKKEQRSTESSEQRLVRTAQRQANTIDKSSASTLPLLKTGIHIAAIGRRHPNCPLASNLPFPRRTMPGQKQIRKRGGKNYRRRRGRAILGKLLTAQGIVVAGINAPPDHSTPDAPSTSACVPPPPLPPSTSSLLPTPTPDPSQFPPPCNPEPLTRNIPKNPGLPQAYTYHFTHSPSYSPVTTPERPVTPDYPCYPDDAPFPFPHVIHEGQLYFLSEPPPPPQFHSSVVISEVPPDYVFPEPELINLE